MAIDYRKRLIDYRKRPKAPAPAATGNRADSAATTPATGGAISLEKVATRAPGLVSLYKSAAVSLAKHRVVGSRAAVYLVLDRSGSMRPFYRDGSVQHLAEQTLALAANLDDDGVVPVVFFSTEVDGIAEIGLDDYRDRVNPLHESMGHMGRTNYHLAMQAVIDHYQACGATDPAFVVFQTDGSPTSRAAAEHVLCTAARLPLFWQFVGFGDDEFRFLRKLDDLPVPARRPVDNAGFFAAGPSPRSLTDSALYDALLAEFPHWLDSARTAGILPAA
ncbi:vWA domain-containing protein [Actinacidiphila guanduensis]|uniref:TerF vWA domain-containing protein n=1 Tax=Actinacidiphila guanduensis TaxID=310781 RepID=A0A1H0P7U5_9ACTN|nr:VWA domain-containing protein [Actinacidiphila guanduensis]SDP01034.1 TerF vWA domain-containing protein [Actinacidiphila guanduensis]